MKFVPRDLGESAEASSGGGRSGLLKEASFLVLAIALVLGTLHISLIVLSELAVRSISMEQELSWLGAMTPPDQWEPDEAYADKVALTRTAMKTLMAAESSPQVDLTLGFVDDPDINAFAFLGGTILVTRGLLDAVEEEAEIAFVLAHEIGHFVHRDHLRSLSRSMGAGVALSILFGDVDASKFVGAGDQLVQLAYSRRQERAADAYGFGLASNAYGKSPSFARVMEKLSADNELPPWAYIFSTHPDARERIRSLTGE